LQPALKVEITGNFLKVHNSSHKCCWLKKMKENDDEKEKKDEGRRPSTSLLFARLYKYHGFQKKRQGSPFGK